MSTLHVRHVPDQVYQAAQRLAHEQRRSLSAYVITLLEQAAADDQRRRSAQALARIRRRRRALPPGVPDVVAMLRKMRGYKD